MGTLTNMILLFAVWSVGLYILGLGTPLTNSMLGNGTAVYNLINMLNQIFGSDMAIAVFGVGIIATAVISGWNFIYLILVPLVVILIGFIAWPADILNAPGSAIGDFGVLFSSMLVILQFIFALFVVHVWRGGEP